MKLRTHVNLIVGCLSAAFVVLVLSSQLASTRRAIREEISAANAVASQLLKNVVDSSAKETPDRLLHFLESLGRVRANDIALVAADGQTIYRSPRSTYKADREAPDWFAKLLLPEVQTRVFALPDGARLQVTANPSRAILDGWDDIAALSTIGLLAFGVLNGLVFWLVGRATASLPIVATGLSRLQQGDLKYRLPTLRGDEANIIGKAFNDMALAVEEKVRAERHAREIEARLEERQELAQLVEQRLEEERRMIAHELHDEFAQSITAIRSLAVAIAANSPDEKSATASAAQLISSEAAHLYDAVHDLIPRLTPLVLDASGLSETLQAFVDEWQRRNPSICLSLRQNLPTTLGQSAALAIYRVTQESVINALRHAHPKCVDVNVECAAERAVVRVTDDGVGLSTDWARPGRFGLRGLRERLEQLGGSLAVVNREGGGVEVRAEIPLLETQLEEWQ